LATSRGIITLIDQIRIIKEKDKVTHILRKAAEDDIQTRGESQWKTENFKIYYKHPKEIKFKQSSNNE
jgi:hypothetical protein